MGDHPRYRIAVVGAGPAGFYAADQLLKAKDFVVAVDMFDKLPTPYGLVRAGVAPDHEKIKNVTRVYDKTAASKWFRFFGNVDIGSTLTVAQMRDHYHQVVYTTGAQIDRNLNIPGIDLNGSHSATEFVAWYNGHPEFRDRQFDLTQSTAVIVGVGNVAVDVARILCRTYGELATTDIADYALEALRESKIETVYMLGRRGPAQAAFTNPEIKELGEMEDADAYVPPDEAALDDASRAYLEANPARVIDTKLEIIRDLAHRERTSKSRRLVIRFCVSPTQLKGKDGRVVGVELVKNELYYTEDGRIRPRATDEKEFIEAGLVFRSVGYHGVAIPGVPFDEKNGTVPNEKGRIVDSANESVVVGEYVAGWIKRGPTGVIGTNKADALETTRSMIEDLSEGRHLKPRRPEEPDMPATLEQARCAFISYEDWLKIDEIEQSRGAASGRPRVKFTTVDEMLQAVGKHQVG